MKWNASIVNMKKLLDQREILQTYLIRRINSITIKYE